MKRLGLLALLICAFLSACSASAPTAAPTAAATPTAIPATALESALLHNDDMPAGAVLVTISGGVEPAGRVYTEVQYALVEANKVTRGIIHRVTYYPASVTGFPALGTLKSVTAPEIGTDRRAYKSLNPTLPGLTIEFYKANALESLSIYGGEGEADLSRLTTLAKKAEGLLPATLPAPPPFTFPSQPADSGVMAQSAKSFDIGVGAASTPTIEPARSFFVKQPICTAITPVSGVKQLLLAIVRVPEQVVIRKTMLVAPVNPIFGCEPLPAGTYEVRLATADRLLKTISFEVK
jgi:hypothetical protein